MRERCPYGGWIFHLLQMEKLKICSVPVEKDAPEASAHVSEQICISMVEASAVSI